MDDMHARPKEPMRRTLTVQCRERGCPNPARAEVTLPEIAPGVTAYPRLVCSGCGCEVYVVPPARM